MSAVDSSFRVKNTIVVNGAFVANSTVVHAAAINATSVNTISVNAVSVNASSLNATESVNTATANATVSIVVGANVTINTTTYFIGNSTVNAAINSTSFSVANSTANTIVGLSDIRIGNTTVNTAISAAAIRTGNTTVNSAVNSTSFSVANSTANTIVGLSDIRIGNTTVNSAVNSTSFSVANSSTITTVGTADIRLGNTAANVVIANTVSSFSGNVGIGTASPGARLNVVDSTSADAVRITQTGSGNAFVVEDATNPDSTPFIIDSSGNVVIGKTTALARLNLAAPDNVTTTYPFRVDNLSNNYGTGYGAYGMSNRVNPVNESVDYTFDVGRHALFRTADTERMRINGDGDVGIGITSLSAKLDIVANTNLRVFETTSNFVTDDPLTITSHYLDINISGTNTALTSARVHTGMYVDVDSTAIFGNTTNDHAIYGIRASVDASGPSEILGNYNDIRANNSTGTVPKIVGNYNVVEADPATGGTITDVVGTWNAVASGGNGAVVRMYGDYNRVILETTGTPTLSEAWGSWNEVEIDGNAITSAYATESVIDIDGGTIGTGYLYYGEYQGANSTNISNSYGVFVTGERNNYFSGNVGIGTSNPVVRLNILAPDNVTTTYPFRVDNNANNYGAGYGAYGMSNRVNALNQSVNYTFDIGRDAIFRAADTERMRIGNDGNITASGNVIINGNLVVTGTTMYANVQNLDVKDLNITVAKDVPSAALANGAGLTVDVAAVTWSYNHTTLSWQSNVGITPASNNNLSLGTPNLVWANLHANNIHGTTINVAAAGDLIIANGAGIEANGSLGTAGHVLHSNGTGVYWAADDVGITSIATSNGLTGGTITSTGTVSVLANTGIIANATGTYVNAAYIGTIGANTANGSLTNTFTVGTASFFVANGNFGVGNTSPEHRLRVEGTLSLSGALHANGSVGTAGQVLLSNGAGTYWGGSTVSVRQTFTATAGQTTFTVSGGYTPNQIDVYYNGAKLINGTEVTVTSGTNVVLASGAVAGAIIDVVGLTASAISFVDAVAKSGDTMSGTLNLPSNGLNVGTTQLVVSGGNVGVGTSTPSARLDVSGTANVSGNVAVGGSLRSANVTTSTNTATFGTAVFIVANGNIGVGTSTPGAALVLPTGSVRIGQNSTNTPGNSVDSGEAVLGSAWEYNAQGSTIYMARSAFAHIRLAQRTSGDNFIEFAHNNGTTSTVRGTIALNGTTGTLYNTTSDYRLKEDLQPISNAVSTVLSTPVYKFRWKEAPDEHAMGFLAHEAQLAVPNAVTGEKDGEKMQQMDYSMMVPMLWAAIQELAQQVQELKAQINS